MGIGHFAMTVARFIGGDLFWNMFLAYRVCWIMGRFGAGKTSLAVIMAARLMAEKRIEKAVSNIPMSFSTTIDTSSYVPLKNAGIVLDEAWIYVDSRSSSMDYGAFIRKFEIFLLLPSVFPIHPRLSFFYVQRIFNGYTVGLPIWVYRWNINNRGIKDSGTFAILNPAAVFGHYPTDFVPGDDGGISKAMLLTSQVEGFLGTRTQQQRKGKNKKDVSMDEEYQTEDYGLENTIESLEDSTYSMEETREEIRRAANVLRKRSS